MSPTCEPISGAVRKCGRCRGVFPSDPDADPKVLAEWWACAPCRAILLPNRAP